MFQNFVRNWEQQQLDIRSYKCVGGIAPVGLTLVYRCSKAVQLFLVAPITPDEDRAAF